MIEVVSMGYAAIDPAPPDGPDLRWRPIGSDDLTAVVELAAACHAVDGGLAFMIEPGTLKGRYFPDAPGVAIGAFDSDARLVACTTLHLSSDSGTQRVTIVGQVRPELRSRGIGSYLMRWSQVRAQRLLTGTGAGQQVLRVITESLTEAADRLYCAHSFVPVFEELVMWRDWRLPLPDRPLLPNVEIVSWQSDLAEQFFQAYDASFRDRPGFPGWNATEWIDWITSDDDLRPDWSLLARVSGRPVGFLIGADIPPHGFVTQVGVVPEYRRQGLGSALLVEAVRRMQATGAASTQLTVNVNNPGAILTYTQLSFATIGRRARYERSNN
jgi:mycothiol synthase